MVHQVFNAGELRLEFPELLGASNNEFFTHQIGSFLVEGAIDPATGGTGGSGSAHASVAQNHPNLRDHASQQQQAIKITCATEDHTAIFLLSAKSADEGYREGGYFVFLMGMGLQGFDVSTKWLVVRTERVVVPAAGVPVVDREGRALLSPTALVQHGPPVNENTATLRLNVGQVLILTNVPLLWDISCVFGKREMYLNPVTTMMSAPMLTQYQDQFRKSRYASYSPKGVDGKSEIFVEGWALSCAGGIFVKHSSETESPVLFYFVCGSPPAWV